MSRHDVAWLAICGAVVGYESWALRHNNDATLSAATRRLFRTSTPWGRYAWFAVLGTLAAWYANHVVDIDDEVLGE